MKFGGQTITFTDRVRSGSPDENGNYDFTTISYSATYCRHRPMSFEEAVSAELDTATEWWRSTIPVHLYVDPLKAQVLTVKPTSKFTVDGNTYEVHGGPRTHPDFNGQPFKTTILSKRQIG